MESRKKIWSITLDTRDVTNTSLSLQVLSSISIKTRLRSKNPNHYWVTNTHAEVAATITADQKIFAPKLFERLRTPWMLVIPMKSFKSFLKWCSLLEKFVKMFGIRWLGSSVVALPPRLLQATTHWQTFTKSWINEMTEIPPKSASKPPMFVNASKNPKVFFLIIG